MLLWPVVFFISNLSICRYLCACERGWEGKNCEREKNECQSNPCQNGGTCNDHLNGYTCLCSRGFAGKGVWSITFLNRVTMTFISVPNSLVCPVSFRF